MKKRILLFALVFALLLGLTGCGGIMSNLMGGSVDLEEYAVGSWQRETMYLDSYGCDADLFITFHADGSVTQLLFEHDNYDNLLSTTYGTWEIEDDQLVFHKSSGGGKVRYDFNSLSKTLENNDKKYTKISSGDVPSVKAPVADAPAIEAPAATEAPAFEDVPAAESDALEDIVCGTWLRETMYLEFYGCDADMYTTFNHDGSASQLLLRHDNGEILNEAAGKWWLEAGEVVLLKDGTTGNIRFQYFEDTNRLKNGDKYYIKID